MPTQTVWVAPELFLEHAGVQVFHTYRDDDIDQGKRQYWLTVSTGCGDSHSLCDQEPCPHVFDVRQLSTWQAPEKPPLNGGSQRLPDNRAAWKRYWEQEASGTRAAVIAAIDRGELTTCGWQAGVAAPPG